MTEQDYTFILDAGKSFTYNAGEYDPSTNTPQYVMTVANLDKSKVEYKQELIKTKDRLLLIWDFNNRSSHSAFISIIKDGVLLK